MFTFLNSPVLFSDKQQPFPHRQWIIRMFDWSYYTHDKTAFQRNSFISWIAVFIGLKILGLSLAKHHQSLFVIICRISAFKKPWILTSVRPKWASYFSVHLNANRTPTKNSKNTYFLTILAWEIFQKSIMGSKKWAGELISNSPLERGIRNISDVHFSEFPCSLFG